MDKRTGTSGGERKRQLRTQDTQRTGERPEPMCLSCQYASEQDHRLHPLSPSINGSNSVAERLNAINQLDKNPDFEDSRSELLKAINYEITYRILHRPYGPLYSWSCSAIQCRSGIKCHRNQCNRCRRGSQCGGKQWKRIRTKRECKRHRYDSDRTGGYGFKRRSDSRGRRRFSSG